MKNKIFRGNEKGEDNMNFYDKIHELVKSLKETEEYKTYIKIKEEIKQDVQLSEKIKEFREEQRQSQMKYISGEELSEESKQEMQQMYSILIQNPKVVEFFQAEIKLDVMLADMQKIIGEGMKEIVDF